MQNLKIWKYLSLPWLFFALTFFVIFFFLAFFKCEKIFTIRSLVTSTKDFLFHMPCGKVVNTLSDKGANCGMKPVCNLFVMKCFQVFL